MLLEDGFAKCTIDAIAREAGVSKATSYRWWSRKSTLVLDAVLAQLGPVVLFTATGDVRADIEAEMRRVIAFYTRLVHESGTMSGLVRTRETPSSLPQASGLTAGV